MWAMFLYDSAVTANELNEICKHSVGSQNTQEKNSQVQDGGGGGGAGGANSLRGGNPPRKL